MTRVWIILGSIALWLAYIGLNRLIAWWNNEIRIARIKNGNKRQIEHFWWGLYYCATCYPVHWAFGWWSTASVVLLHLSVFPVFFNRYSDLPAFNLSKTSSAVTDRIMAWLGLKTSAPVNMGALIVSIALLIKSIL